MMMLIASLVVAIGCVGQVSGEGGKASASREDAPVKAAADFPHPLVTEVLFNVPRGVDGDANRDGTRSATGDEFVELFNPYDKPINLKGYRLIDGTTVGGKHADASSGKGGAGQRSEPKTGGGEGGAAAGEEGDSADADAHFEFVFPELVLQPGEVAVVFNGLGTSMTGEVGTSEKAAGKHERFGGAYVFNAKMASQYAAFSNQHDVVQLLSPKGEAVETIRWDYRDNKPGERGSSPSGRGQTGAGSGGEKQERATGGSSSRGKPAREVLDKRAEEAAGRVENLPRVRNGSVQREGVAGAFRPHAQVGGTLCSPGVFSSSSGK
jgi:hypothetical protein